MHARCGSVHLYALACVAPHDTRRATARRTERPRQTNVRCHPPNDHIATTGRLKSRKSFMTTNPFGTSAAAARVSEWHKRLASLEDRTNLEIPACEALPPGANQEWTIWETLKHLRTAMDRSRVNMLKWG